MVTSFGKFEAAAYRRARRAACGQAWACASPGVLCSCGKSPYRAALLASSRGCRDAKLGNGGWLSARDALFKGKVALHGVRQEASDPGTARLPARHCRRAGRSRVVRGALANGRHGQRHPRQARSRRPSRPCIRRSASSGNNLRIQELMLPRKRDGEECPPGRCRCSARSTGRATHAQ
jgi:hypothetical protein